MTGKQLLDAVNELDEFWKSFDGHFGRRENREHARRYSRGQLGTIERKSLEPMADADGIDPRTLQFFFSKNEWDDVGVLDDLQRRIAQQYGDEDGVFLVDETSDAKKGRETAGVSRQYCGETGKIDNCIVTVHLGYCHNDFHALLDGRLFLPERWDANPDDPVIQARRKRTGIPNHVRYRSKAHIAIDLLQNARKNGVPGRYLTADEGYGGKPWWRDEVGALGLIYVCEVPSTTWGVLTERAPNEATAVVRKVADLASREDGLGRKVWQRYEVHKTEKGPEIWEFKAGKFSERREEGLRNTGRMIVGRNTLTGELKYFLSNATEEVALDVLVTIAFSRWQIERCFQDCKSELGLNHAEMRKYKAIQRHLTLTAVNYFFLVDWMTRNGGKKDGSYSFTVRRCAAKTSGEEIGGAEYASATAGTRRAAR